MAPSARWASWLGRGVSTGPSGISGVNDRAVEAGLDWGVGVGEARCCE